MFFNYTELPKPLKHSEQRSLFNDKIQGDETARQKLIEGNLRLVVRIAKRFANENMQISEEDLIAEGTVGLIKAVNTFKLEKDIKFSTYASRCIRNEISMYLRKQRKHRGIFSLDEPWLEFDDGGTTSLADMISGEDVELRIMDSIQVEELIAVLDDPNLKLTERERTIIWFRYLQSPCLKQSEVAERLGLSKSYARKLENNMLKKLRAKLS